jgi:hypothetical protein
VKIGVGSVMLKGKKKKTKKVDKKSKKIWK